jgi:large subunit ribosomal protein L12
MEYIYGALLLHKLGKPITEDNLTAVIKAAGASVDDAKVKAVIASLNGVDIAKELENASFAAAAPSAAAAGGEAKEEAKEEAKVEEAAEGLSALFG